METDMKRMNNNWIEIEKNAEDRVVWRMLLGGLYFIVSNRLYHYTNQYGIQYDTIGWEQSIIINVSEVTKSDSLTSFKWNEIIYSVVNDFKQSHPNRMIQHNDYDCLDFVVDIIKYAIDDQQINRILIAQWLSIHLEWIILYENIRKQLESGSLQVISKLHHIV
ncbi:unnamed protein product [Schistosoma curassoni]|uniref:ULP_PROTEASE domain-containing protein n=1 Tax=Schistosoma curassoni TaxID=6186 RepID=A0A183KIK9_9TREM|nr:unnamed protein product [Schistosoma curassoni]